MNRGGRDHSAPRLGERGWFPAHPSVSADRPTYAPAGTGPSSHDHISGARHNANDSNNWRSRNRHTITDSMNPQSQYRHTTTGGTNWQSGRHSARHSPRGRSWHRSEGAPGRRQMQRHTEWKQVRPVAVDTSAAQGCPSSSDRITTDSEVSSHEFNCHAKIQGSDCCHELSISVVIERGSGMDVGDGPLAHDSSFLENNLVDETPIKHAGQSGHSDCKGSESVGGSESAIKQDCVKNLESERGDAVKLDICPPKASTGFKLKESLLESNRAKRNQEKRSQAPTRIVLRDGMVLLKGYVSLSEQVKIVKQCQRLGLGHGGFYQPGYRDGAKLNLRMMCLGKNWDPETTSYTDTRLTDGAKPPPIPGEFFELVERSIKESHKLIAEECRYSRAEAIIPGMSPDICIVNFYSTSGRLGLHQDRDESERSLQMGLPVVSVSIGDSAEFLYGDQRDVDKAEKVLLESGDVLIFGGKSRHVFHGVSSVKPETAPKPLLEQTNLRPGRLNLTFRKY